MRFRYAIRALLVAVLSLASSHAFGWGYAAHRLITRKACDAMPEPVRVFFVANRNALAEHSIDPDLWRKEDKTEGPRHFLDMDYEAFGKFPFAELPRDFDAAVAKFGKETFDKVGYLPWRIDEYMGAVVEAMKSGDAATMVPIVGAYAHYIEDAHMPLHGVINYDGQFTNQKGVHGRWEWNLVERYESALDAAVVADPTRVRVVASPRDLAFDVLLDSYARHFELLNDDRRAAEGVAGSLDANETYFARLWELSGDLCIRQMSEAATQVASLWLTAWERAGRPNLPLPAETPQAPVRARDLGVRIGRLEPGPWNAITDVAGVRVGHVTLVEGDGESAVRTGVTAVVPRDDVWHKKVPAAVYSFNGNGEVTGAHWIREAGWLEVPILLTSTLNVPRVANGVVSWMEKVNPKMSRGDDVVLPVVAECDDSGLNDSRGRHVSEEDVIRAIETASAGPVAEGNVGAGTGLVCYGFKGGIGTASRKTEEGYTVGALVEANGGRRSELRVDGVPVGETIRDMMPEWGPPEKSFIIVVATDAPLDARQLERIARRASWGLARTGTVGRHGSGDFVIAFSTATEVPHFPDEATYNVTAFADAELNALFTATVEATEEAIVNALMAAKTTVGRRGRTVYALPHDRLREALYRAGRLQTGAALTNGKGPE
jgi:D-aminopeptidase